MGLIIAQSPSNEGSLPTSPIPQIRPQTTKSMAHNFSGKSPDNQAHPIHDIKRSSSTISNSNKNNDVNQRKNSTSSTGSACNQTLFGGSNVPINQMFDETRSPNHSPLSPSPLREHGLLKNSIPNLKGNYFLFSSQIFIKFISYKSQTSEKLHK